MTSLLRGCENNWVWDLTNGSVVELKRDCMGRFSVLVDDEPTSTYPEFMVFHRDGGDASFQFYWGLYVVRSFQLFTTQGAQPWIMQFLVYAQTNLSGVDCVLMRDGRDVETGKTFIDMLRDRFRAHLGLGLALAVLTILLTLARIYIHMGFIAIPIVVGVCAFFVLLSGVCGTISVTSCQHNPYVVIDPASTAERNSLYAFGRDEDDYDEEDFMETGIIATTAAQATSTSIPNLADARRVLREAALERRRNQLQETPEYTLEEQANALFGEDGEDGEDEEEEDSGCGDETGGLVV